MVKVILVRHGETDWNRREVFRGRADIELNKRGREQAKALAAAVKDIQIDAVYSSPLRRAVETAEAIAQPHGITVKMEPGFIDFDYGVWQGLPHDEVRRRYPEMYKDWIERPHAVRVEGGESLRMVRRRTMEALADIVERREEEAVCRVWTRAAEGHDLECRRFKGGVELRLLGIDKGTALATLLREQSPQSLCVYIGDDLTDEDAFRVLKNHGYGIKVGGPEEPTDAVGKLADPAAVKEFLETWLSITTEN